MNILSTEMISKSYGEKVLFKDISIGISDSDKIGFIGINGTGKSTLLRVLAGIESPDSGRIIAMNGMRIEYLPQNPEFQEGITVLEQVFKGNSPLMKLLREYEAAFQAINAGVRDKKLEQGLLDLTQQMDNLDAWALEAEAKAVLTRLGIDDFQAEVSKLSGGQKKRIAIASALITPVDLLLLDEPTNHIDNETVDWLENYLNNRKGALVMVTHDRYFLERVANKIIEIDNGQIFSYQANYSKFLEMKAERQELTEVSERKRQRLIKSELEWIRKGARARSTKQKARIERFEKLSEEKGIVSQDDLQINIVSSRLGKKIIELEHVDKSFGSLEVIKDFSYVLQKDDRIGIIGSNGRGKSTLLNLMVGKLQPNRGTIEIGETVKIGFLSQENYVIDESLRVIEFIEESAQVINTGKGLVTAAQMLELFLFSPVLQWTRIANLSGGEKRRLKLLKILMEQPNVLLMDEPTNDLDIQTLAVLEDYLDRFPGVVVVVSHDRYFLDRVVSKIFSFEGQGVIREYPGNYADYQAIKKERAEVAVQENIKPEGKKEKVQPRKDRPLKMSFNEQREFDQIDERIALLENSLIELEGQLEAAADDYVRLQELVLQRKVIEDELEEAVERWVYLHELAEEISQNKRDLK